MSGRERRGELFRSYRGSIQVAYRQVFEIKRKMKKNKRSITK